MNLARGLERRAADGRPVRVGVIGAGKFGSMFLAQARRTPGLHVVAIADRDVAKVRGLLAAAGWEDERLAAPSAAAALDSGRTHLGEDADRVIATDGIEVLVEATGDPRTGLRHAVAAIAAGRHLVMVTVEADAVAGPLLAERAAAAGVVYSLAYGDQPALICEQVDWARTAGFRVTAAGKGTRYHPAFHQSTPATVWENYGLAPAVAERGRMDPKMFNSFIDGSKSAIEMTAVCNATGLVPQPDGLRFPPVGRDELAHCSRPRAAGGLLQMEPGGAPVTEVVSSLRRDRTPVPHDLRMGTYVVVEAGQEYVAQCIREYGFQADTAGAYLALYRPDHLIGLELGVSGGLGCPARRAHRRPDRVPLRRGRRGQARPGRRRGAGRRGRLHGVGQAASGRPLAGAGRAAAGAGPGRYAAPRPGRRRGGALDRRDAGRDRPRGDSAPRHGAALVPAVADSIDSTVSAWPQLTRARSTVGGGLAPGRARHKGKQVERLNALRALRVLRALRALRAARPTR